MLYGILADLVVFTHLLWILFLIAGAYLGRKHRTIMAVHGAALAFAIVSQVIGWACPLTYLEIWLREKQPGSPAYSGSFIAYYAEKFVYINVTPAVIFVATLILVGVNVWVYRRAFRKTGSSVQ